MTDLQLMYSKHRLDGKRHWAAIDAIAAETGIDRGSVFRAIERAEREQRPPKQKTA